MKSNFDIPVDVDKLLHSEQWGNLEMRWWIYNHERRADTPGAYHIKLITVDGELVYNGSTNWDVQSMNLSRECSFMILDSEYTDFVDDVVFQREWDLSEEGMIDKYTL